MVVWLPVMVVVTVSVAVIVYVGELAFLRTTPVNVNTPLSPAMNAWVIGKVPFVFSVSLHAALPISGVVLLFASAAVTVTDPPVSALAGFGKPATSSLAVVPG